MKIVELDDIADRLEAGEENLTKWDSITIETTKVALVRAKRYEAASRLLEFQRSVKSADVTPILNRLFELKKVLKGNIEYYESQERYMCEAVIEARGGLMVITDLLLIIKNDPTYKYLQPNVNIDD